MTTIRLSGRLAGRPKHQPILFQTFLTYFIVFVIAACSFVGLARSQELASAVRPNDMESGSLLLKRKDGGYMEAPRLGADYRVTISGLTGRTILTQRFQNPAEGWVEGVYVFPLPESAAVDTLKIIAGERIIVGEVKEKVEAKVIYEAAKAAGQTAALLEQERPNLFTNSVANIGPGETVVVQIEYQETIKQSLGTYSLRLPLVVAPRYNPAPIVQTVEFSTNGEGFGTVIKDPVPDRDKIEPPVLDPAQHGKVNPVTISITLNAGFELADVKSHHHQVAVKSESASLQTLTLADADVPADKDFELTWAAKGTAPQVGLFKETIAGTDYLLATVTPPTSISALKDLPREVVFVIDNSGSMEGPSMDQAKTALIQGLSKLKPTDRFNVIRFDDTFDVMYPDAIAASAENIAQATGWVSSLQANGGTEMVPALRAALRDYNLADKTYLRQVVFITDGAIGNEQEMFATLTLQRGRSRVFMVGIGSAPNSYLMTRAAEMGRGTFTFIGDAAQVIPRMDELFTKIGQPIVTELAATLNGEASALTPSTLPDLYRGEPVVMMATGKALSGQLVVSGKIGDTPWQVSIPVAGAAQAQGISKLWAHRKIAEIETLQTLGQVPYDEGLKQILAVALTHQIVSSQTSLIALDKTPKRAPGVALTRADIPLNLPSGWSFEMIFGKDLPLPTKDERDANARAFTQLAMVEKPAVAADTMQQQVNLPETATPSQIMGLFGLLLLLLAAMFRFFAVRQVRFA